MARAKSYTPITRQDLVSLVPSVLAVHVKVSKKTGKKVRRFQLVEGKTALDVISAIPAETANRLFIDGLNRELYFNSGSGAAARLAKQVASLKAKLAMAEETASKVSQDVE